MPDVALDPARLSREIARRGLTSIELAKRANVSKNTLTKALAGWPLRRRTIERIARVLMETATRPVLDGILPSPDRTNQPSESAP